ncbi:MAG: hypothetical protein WAL63_09580 [Solirubrobacteraceae bacterium]
MRTTLTFSDDVAAAVEHLRRERSIGVSEAVNELIRAGLIKRSGPPTAFRQESHDLGHGIDFDRAADTLETLETLSSR